MEKEIIFNYEGVDIQFLIIDSEIFINSTKLAKIVSFDKNASYDVIRPNRWKALINMKNVDDLIIRRSVRGKRGGNNALISEFLIFSYLSWLGDYRITSWIIDRLIEIRTTLVNDYLSEIDYNRLIDILISNNNIFDFDRVFKIKDDLIYFCYNNELVSISKVSILNKLWIFRDINLVIDIIRLLDKLNDSSVFYVSLRFLVLASVDPINKRNLLHNINQRTYLMKDSNTGYTKIGKAIDPKYRERTLQSEKPTISLFAVCDDNIELELHKKFEDKRIRGEWFDLKDNELIEIVNQYSFKII